MSCSLVVHAYGLPGRAPGSRGGRRPLPRGPGAALRRGEHLAARGASEPAAFDGSLEPEDLVAFRTRNRIHAWVLCRSRRAVYHRRISSGKQNTASGACPSRSGAYDRVLKERGHTYATDGMEDIRREKRVRQVLDVLKGCKGRRDDHRHHHQDHQKNVQSVFLEKRPQPCPGYPHKTLSCYCICFHGQRLPLLYIK